LWLSVEEHEVDGVGGSAGGWFAGAEGAVSGAGTFRGAGRSASRPGADGLVGEVGNGLNRVVSQAARGKVRADGASGGIQGVLAALAERHHLRLRMTPPP